MRPASDILNAYILGAIDHMMIGQDIAVFTHRNAGAKSTLHFAAPSPLVTRRPKEAAEKRDDERGLLINILADCDRTNEEVAVTF